VIEHALARSVLLGRLVEANSPAVRYRREWLALRADPARANTAVAPISVLQAEPTPVDRFLSGKEIERAA